MTTPMKSRSHESSVPPLEAGDRMTRDEFERRYESMPDIKKAELIEGIVHMPSPVRWTKHGSPHFSIVSWLGVYRATTFGVQGGDNSSLRLDLQNEPQPDAALIIEPACGGNVRISSDDYVIGSPELIAEVAASSVSIDLNTKLRIYRRNMVQEYVVWRVLDQAIDWFVLRHGDYERLPQSVAGVHESGVFPGLWLNSSAMIHGDMAKVLEVVAQGIASAAHSAFIERLQRAAARRGP